MYVIYHGNGSTIIPAVLASLHLDQFILRPPSTLLPQEDMDHFYQIVQKSRGRLVFMGKDQQNNAVYVLNTAASASIILPALSSVFQVLQISEQLLYLVDTSEITNYSLLLGSLLYRIPLSGYGNRFLYQGLFKEKVKIEELVKKVHIMIQN